jgi:hypothetical protein
MIGLNMGVRKTPPKSWLACYFNGTLDNLNKIGERFGKSNEPNYISARAIKRGLDDYFKNAKPEYFEIAKAYNSGLTYQEASARLGVTCGQIVCIQTQLIKIIKNIEQVCQSIIA